MSSKVMPFGDSPRDHGIPLSSLNPDLDGNGRIEPWEKEVYDRIVAADTDNTGIISVRNLFDFIRRMSAEVKEAATGGIPITSLNPDSDGDGKVEKWEQEVFSRIQAADADQSGSISVKELFGVIKGAAESDKAKRLFRRLFFVALLIIFMLVGSMLAVSIVAGEMVKESHVKGGLMTTKEGGAVKVDVAQSKHTLFSLAALPIEGVETIERISLYVNTTGNAELGNGIVESTFQVSSAMKFAEESVAFFTPSGSVIKIDGAAMKATITMDGATYSVDDEDRSVIDDDTETTPSRRRLRRGRKPSLRTRGRFSMSFQGGAAGGTGRRELQ